MIDVSNERRLPIHLRLGLAWCRLNMYEWDDIVGPKPPNWDNLPTTSKEPLFGKKKPSKSEYVKKPMEKIKHMIGTQTTTLCWWVFVLKKPPTDFLQWYLKEFGYPFKNSPNRL